MKYRKIQEKGFSVAEKDSGVIVQDAEGNRNMFLPGRPTEAVILSVLTIADHYFEAGNGARHPALMESP